MKILITIASLLFFCSTMFGQQMDMISQGGESDSSFYHIEKIGDNEFWAGGENGILKSIDSLGNVRSLNFPNAGIAILSIKKTQNYVFIVTADAVIYRYDFSSESFYKKKFPAFSGKCFYDLIELKNGGLLVCGGTSGIAKGEKRIPRGFIAKIDFDLGEVETVWKSSRKFVWSLLELDDSTILAATFNGVNTKVIESEDLERWTRYCKIKGLVHEIALLDREIWYCGTKSIRFKGKGIVGRVNKVVEQKMLSKTGCLWSLDTIGEKIITVSHSGELLLVNRQNLTIENIKFESPFTVYDIEKISESKLLIVGHGKSACIIDF